MCKCVRALNTRKNTLHQVGVTKPGKRTVFFCHLLRVLHYCPWDLETPSVEWTGVDAWSTEFPPYEAVAQGVAHIWGVGVGGSSSPRDLTVLFSVDLVESKWVSPEADCTWGYSSMGKHVAMGTVSLEACCQSLATLLSG